jgi:hypothetical protein
MNKKTNWPLTIVLIILSPVLLPLIFFCFLLLLIAVLIAYLLVYFAIWAFWLTRGKDVLFVYSDSPIWRDYMLAEMLPLVKTRAVILNWSERSTWERWSLRVIAFRLFAGRKAFNPMLVVFRPFRLAKRFRFYSAFREWKQGNRQGVEKMNRDVMSTLTSS